MTPPKPVPPSPAATLVLLRDRPAGGVEVLLIQRHPRSKFAGGDFVFPGGKIIRPRVLGEGATRTVLLPGDPGYF